MKCIVEALADVLSRPHPMPVSQECLVILKTGKQLTFFMSFVKFNMKVLSATTLRLSTHIPLEGLVLLLAFKQSIKSVTLARGFFHRVFFTVLY